MKALILAAGFGKRLEPYTQHTPKPLFSLSNQPILDRIIRILSGAGISSVVVNTHHLHHQIETYLASQTYSVPVITRHEPDILGTGGAIKNLADFWDDDPFMVINSDILFDTDLDAFCRYHANNACLATLMLCDEPLFNQVWVDPKNCVVGFGKNARPLSAKNKPLTFTGIQIVHPELLDFIPGQGFYSIIDAYKTALSANKTIRAFTPHGLSWTDIGSVERYHETACRTITRHALKTIGLHHDSSGFEMHKLAGDGSDRLWYRINSADTSIILVDHGIRTGPETQEVDSFIRIGKHLLTKDVPVPAIILSDPFAGLVVLEDLGDTHLQDIVQKNKTNTEYIRTLYRGIIDDLIPMALAGRDGFEAGWTWQSATYDPDLIIEKECRYFVEAFLNRYLEMNVHFADLESDFKFLAESAMNCQNVGFMHRDFQSRNIMVHRERCYFIDFQGGRTGPLQYDLSSLLYDPYVGLDQDTILTLYKYYVNRLSTQGLGHETTFENGFETCAITRNLQILGAFGHLSKNRGKTYFEAFIPGALQTLYQNLENYHAKQRLYDLRQMVQKAHTKLSPKQ